MKKIAGLVLILAIGFLAGQAAPVVVMADWTPGENQRLFEHVARIAEAMHNARMWGKKLSDIAVDEGVATDVNFIDVAPWVKQEVLDMKAVLDDFEVFMTGSDTLPAENRAAAIHAMLLGLN